MRFLVIALVAPVVLARSGAKDFGRVPIELKRSESAAASDCTTLYNYCGWFLIGEGAFLSIVETTRPCGRGT